MEQKNVVLIGASGFVGKAILEEALNRGHKVTAVVRFPEKITMRHANLVVKAHDIMDEQMVQLMAKGADAVISAYNPGWGNPNIVEDTKKGYASIIKGVKEAKGPRLLIVGGAGSLYVKKDVRVMDTSMIPEAILPGVKALADVYYALQKDEHQLDWTFFSPAGNIQPGKRTGKFRLGTDSLLVDEKGESNISVEDYAVAMIDELEKSQHSRKRFTIAY